MTTLARPIRIAAAQWPVFEPANWQTVTDTLTQWVADAKAQGAELLVFPEYGSLVLGALFDDATRASLTRQLAALQTLHEPWIELHRALAMTHGVHILAGSFPVAGGGEYSNRAHLFAPGGDFGFQDKWTMTRFEAEQWGISAGRTLKVFDTALGTIGIAICYDIEFPLLARAQVEAGATVLLAPSCTDTAAGYWRVRVGAQARALENQCVVVQSPLVGDAPWSAAVDVNVGAAGFYTPPDRGLPDDGVLACGTWNAAQWLIADIDPARLAAVRANGQVLNHRDWCQQPGLASAVGVTRELLR